MPRPPPAPAPTRPPPSPVAAPPTPAPLCPILRRLRSAQRAWAAVTRAERCALLSTSSEKETFRSLAGGSPRVLFVGWGMAGGRGRWGVEVIQNGKRQIKTYQFGHSIFNAHQQHTYDKHIHICGVKTISTSIKNGILNPKGSTRAEFAPFSHEPGFAFLEQNDLKRLVFSAHCALCFSFLQRDFRIKPAHNQKIKRHTVAWLWQCCGWATPRRVAPAPTVEGGRPPHGTARTV